MYAVMSQWQMDEQQFDSMLPELEARIIPAVQQTPGFIKGFWNWDHSNGKTADMLLYETEEQARAVKAWLEQQPTENPDPRARLEVVRVLELVGSTENLASAHV